MSNAMSVKLGFMSNLILDVLGVSVAENDIEIREEHKLVLVHVKPDVHIEFEYNYNVMVLEFFAIVSKGEYSNFSPKSVYTAFKVSIEDIIDDKVEIAKALAKLDIS